MLADNSAQRLKNSLKDFSSKHTLVSIYLLFFGISSIVFLTSIIFTRGTTLSNAFFSDKSDTFMDFFNSVMYSSDLPYTKYTVIYPALITVFYKAIGYFTILFDVSMGDSIAHQMRNSQSAMMVFIIVTLIAIYFLLILLRRYFEKSSNLKVELLSVLLICSYPLMYAIERGNSIVYVLVALLFYVLFYNSQNKFLRYISYFCLGIATGIKIYVVFFGLLILRERSYREFILCCILILILFFVPFIFTDGTIYALMHNIFSYTGGASEVPGSFHNIKELLGYFSELLDSSMRYYLQYLLFILLYLCTFVVCTFGKSLELWKITTLICSACVLGMGTGAPYNFCLYIIPFTMLLSNDYNPTRRNTTYVLLFIFMFIWIPAPSEGLVKCVEVIHFLPAYLLTLLVFGEFFVSVIKRETVRLKCNNQFNDDAALKCVIIALIGATVIILITLITPYLDHDSAAIDNVGQNSGRFIESDEEFTFSYDSGTFISSDGVYQWNPVLSEFLISTDNGFVSSDSVMYYTSDGQRIGAILPNSWTGCIKNGCVSLDYSDSIGAHSIAWTYFEFAVAVSSEGNLSIYSIAAGSQRVYVNSCDLIYGVTYSDENSSIIGTVGNSAYTNGEIIGTVCYTFKQEVYYTNAVLFQTSASGSTISVDCGTETHISEFIVPKSIYSELNFSQKELKITFLVCAGIIILCVLGLVILVIEDKLRKSKINNIITK